MLPITLTIAAALALLNLWLASRTVRARSAAKVTNGDGGDPLLQARMRAQANLVDYAPFFLILLGLLERARGSEGWLWAVGIAFVAGRLLHPFGLERPAPNVARVAGILLTWAMLLAVALAAVWTVYAAR